MKSSKMLGKITDVSFISDPHFGSDWAPMPPPDTVTLTSGEGNTQNPLQKEMDAVWVKHTNEMLAYLNGRRFLLVLNGDILEGSHHRSDEALAKVDDHMLIAEYYLAPLIKACEKAIMVYGTECHTGRKENSLAKKWPKKFMANPAIKTQLAFDAVEFDVGGCLYNVTHHMACTTKSYLEAGALSTIMGDSRNQHARAKRRSPDVWLRAHRHCCGYYSDGRGLIAVNGAYQFKTRHGTKVVPDAEAFPSMMVFDHSRRIAGQLPMVEVFGTSLTQTPTVII
jgi:hypothetical protein